MKKFFYSLLLVLFTLSSCSDNPTSELEEQAKETFKISFAKMTEDDENVKIEKINTMFSNDSLCILHIEVKGKNKFGAEVTNKLEYLFTTQSGKSYEAFQDLDKDSIYVSAPTLKKLSKGMIYENLSFEEATLYRCVMYINSKGQEVGNKDAEFKLPIPTGTGLWELDRFTDDFGDKISEKYLRLTGYGEFSNSAATNEKMVVCLFADKNNAHFRFLEYGTSVVKDPEYYNFKIKDSKGTIHNLRFFCSSEGYIGPSVYSNNSEKEFRKIIEMEGVISVHAELDSEYSHAEYQFKLNLDGFKKACTFL